MESKGKGGRFLFSLIRANHTDLKVDMLHKKEK